MEHHTAAADVSASIPSSLLPVLDDDALGLLIKKTPAAIARDRVRAPWRVPPACTPPGTKKPLWILEDVLTWLRQYQERPGEDDRSPIPEVSVDAARAAALQSRKRRGPPTTIEREAARAVGLSVPEWRAVIRAQAQQEGGAQ